MDEKSNRKVLILEKINKFYGTETPIQVLFDVDLAFEEGSFNSLIGQSGSGKTTLLNIIGTLDRPSSGSLTINGKKTETLNNKGLATLRNEELGFIFQFHYLLPEYTARENVLIPWRIRHTRVPNEVEQRADELMDLVGLAKVKNNLASKMSGGQQQRTAIARALINEPSIILADEPTGNLDSDTTQVVYQLLREINERLKTTFLIVTHDRRVAERTDRVVEIRDGRVVLDIAQNPKGQNPKGQNPKGQNPKGQNPKG